MMGSDGKCDYFRLFPKIFMVLRLRVSQSTNVGLSVYQIIISLLFLSGQKLQTFHSKAHRQKLSRTSIYFLTVILPQYVIYV